MLQTHGKQRLSILIFHRVLPQYDAMRPFEPTTATFVWQMRAVRKYFNPLPLLEAVDKLHTSSLPERAICITFDDGYADNQAHALPILQRYDIPATFFISTGFLNGGLMWNDTIIESLRSFAGTTLDLRHLDLECYPLESLEQRLTSSESIIQKIKHRGLEERSLMVEKISEQVDSLPHDLMLTDAQIRILADSGATIGAHTVNHPILSGVSHDVAVDEIGQSKAYLQNVIQSPVEVFAYPNGKPSLDYCDEHVNMVEAMGFKAAVSTHWGVGTKQSDRFQLPRFTPWDSRELKFVMRLLENYRRVDSLVTG